MPNLITADIDTKVVLTAIEGQTVFTYPFPIFEAGDLRVIVNEAPNLAYSVTGIGKIEGGQVVFATPLVAGDQVFIARILPIRRFIDLPTTGPVNMENVDLEFDRVMAVEQQLQGAIEGSLRLPEYESLPALPPASGRANRYLGFGPDGLLAVLTTGTNMALALLADLVTLLGSAFKGDPGSPGEGYATRASMATALNTATPLDDFYLTERGRQGKWVFYSAALYAIDFPDRVLTADVGADPNQTFLVAAASAASGANGAAVRMFEGPVDPRWGGLVPEDDVSLGAGNSALNDQLLTTCDALDHRHIKYRGGHPFRLASRMDVKYPDMRIEGTGGGLGGTEPILKFAGTGGIAVQGDQTSGTNTKDAAAHSDGRGTTLINLTIDGGFTGTEGEFHGMQLRTKANVESCSIFNFPGDGLKIAASKAAGNGAEPPYGNANTCHINRVTIDGCRDGTKIDGNDVNAITLGTINANNNRRWANWDSSFLGNSIPGGQNNGNGVTSWNTGLAATTPASVVSYLGRWYAVVVGQEAAAALPANVPSGTSADTAHWIYLSLVEDAVINAPAWFSGIFLRAGGAGYFDNDAAKSVVVGQYAEPNQGKFQTNKAVLIIGGKAADWVYISPLIGSGVIRMRSGTIRIDPGIEVVSGTVTASLGGGNGNVGLVLSKFIESTYIAAGLTTHVNAASGDIYISKGEVITIADTFMQLFGPVSTTVTGSGVQVNSLFIPRLLLRTNGGTVADAKLVYRAAAVADSAAADVAGVNTKINAILTALRNAGLMTV